MKKIFKILLSSLLIVSFSCHEDESPTGDMFSNYEQGAVLRTIEDDSNNNILNSSNNESFFSQVVEAQDEQDGGLMQEVRVMVEHIDFSSEYETPATGDNLVYTIPASEFETGPFGLPRTTILVTFGDAANALGLTLDEVNGYQPGDLFRIKLELVLTDGRVYTAADAASMISGGFFKAPFQYNALISCSPEPGTYTVYMYDNYGDGWQTGDYSQGLSVDIDGEVTMIAMCSQWGDYEFECLPTTDGYYAETTVTIPEGTESATWNWPGDQYGEIALAVVGPNGEPLFGTVFPADIGADVEGGLVPVGLLPITLCAQ
jgi:hypothetical protein